MLYTNHFHANNWHKKNNTWFWGNCPSWICTIMYVFVCVCAFGESRRDTFWLILLKMVLCVHLHHSLSQPVRHILFFMDTHIVCAHFVEKDDHKDPERIVLNGVNADIRTSDGWIVGGLANAAIVISYVWLPYSMLNISIARAWFCVYVYVYVRVGIPKRTA